MKKTLIIEQSKELENFYAINLLTWTGSSSVGADSALFATEYLDKNKDIDLILVKAKNKIEKSAEIIFNYLTEKKLDIPLLVLGSSSLNTAEVNHVTNGLEIKPIIQNCAKLLKVTAQDMAALGVPAYFQIPLQYFSQLSYSICDVFQEDGGQFKCISKANEVFAPNMIEVLTKMNVTSLYVPKNDRLRFVGNLTQEFASRLKSSASLSSDETIIASELTNELLREKLSVLGLTDDTIALAQENMKQIVANAKSHNKLAKLMASLLRNKSGFLFKHTQILTFICQHIIQNLDWGNMEQIEKMAFICFFHDISLTKDEYAKIRTEAELKKSALSTQEKELVSKHAQLSAQLIMKYPKAPMASDVIIKQHHGILHGVGFSETYSANLSPMAIVFILAEDYTEDLIELAEKFNHSAKIAQMRERYATQRFKKIIDLLEELSVPT